MRVLFNEMSCGERGDQFTDAEVVELLIELIDSIDFIRQISGRENPTFYVTDPQFLSDNGRFLGRKSIKTCAVLLRPEYKSALSFMLVRTHVLPLGNHLHTEINLRTTTDAIVPYLRLQGARVGSLSVFTNEVWQEAMIRFEPGGVVESIFNFPKIEFTRLEQYVEAAEACCAKVAAALGQEAGEFLPLKRLTNYFLSNRKFKLSYAKGGQRDKLADYQIVGAAVARINGYVADPVISSINATDRKKRNIFFNGKLEKYISIDYEKGAFELHDLKGKHLGEYNYQGDLISGADLKGGHDIRLSR